jgi:hypothetical protein
MTDATPRRYGFPRILLLAGAMLVALAALFWTSGALFPTRLPDHATSARQITGIALMLSLLPPYLVVALAISQRRSFRLIGQLRPMLPDPQAAEAACDGVRGALRRSWKIGTLVGIAFGLLNTQPIPALTRDPAPAVAGSLAFGQLLLWWLIGVVLVTRINAARVFRRLGESVSFDLFQLDDLRPLVRAGVIDVAIVAGALLFTPLQSLDAEFRWYNYHFAMLVALPAASFFLIWPLRGVHRRIRRDRDARVAAVEAQLRAARAERDPDAEAIVRSEALLAHRDRLRGARTWPLSTGLLSRVLLYLVFPPLAWAGAALTERILEWALGG